jgi:hypothetical protein
MSGTLTLFSIHLHNHPAIKTPVSRLKGNSSKQYLKMRPSPLKPNNTTATNMFHFNDGLENFAVTVN